MLPDHAGSEVPCWSLIVSLAIHTRQRRIFNLAFENAQRKSRDEQPMIIFVLLARPKMANFPTWYTTTVMHSQTRRLE